MTSKWRKRVLWTVFLFLAFYGVLRMIGILFRWNPDFLNSTDFVIFYLPILFLFVYCILTMGILRGVGIILVTFLIGSLFEFIGLKYGSFFGGHYFYRENYIMLLGIPVVISFYWAGLIIIGYELVSSFLLWLGREKPNRIQKNFVLLSCLILLDGLVVTAMSILLDPVGTRMELWSWQAEGSHFGTPLGNFWGWFLITIIAMGLFRFFEYYYPQKKKLTEDSVHLIPVFGYALLCFGLCIKAILLELPSLAYVGFFAMFPITAINIFIYLLGRNKRYSKVTSDYQ